MTPSPVDFTITPETLQNVKEVRRSSPLRAGYFLSHYIPRTHCCPVLYLGIKSSARGNFGLLSIPKIVWIFNVDFFLNSVSTEKKNASEKLLRAAVCLLCFLSLLPHLPHGAQSPSFLSPQRPGSRTPLLRSRRPALLSSRPWRFPPCCKPAFCSPGPR